ncbi:Zinc finger B-box domain containing protein 1 isoform 1 [Dorcoceras hygrometricum]|uniref:Zinc finger B-box domain containing protein 1 isoform 1 n=1 Tax=Dorcoceras hygrometricum TaxID=472368 RepID=A0A2Z7CKC2_9LAMI|nr:Zinc finger B-box domain containing protein 1 isoform 1 [Dorcoceras hygrometricum]
MSMDFLGKQLNEDTSDCSLSKQDIQKCPFLRNINKPTDLSFSSLKFPAPLTGVRGPIFEDGPNFDLAFKLFHGKDGVVPLSGSTQPYVENLDTDDVRHFNPLVSKAASISMSAFGPGGPFGFHSFLGKNQNKTPESSGKEELSPKGDSSKHEALGNEWLRAGNCPVAKSYRAMSNILPLVATALQPQPGIKLKCPPAVVAARAALAKTALVKTMRPQPLPAKVLVIGMLGIAANIPLGAWREHTRKLLIILVHCCACCNSVHSHAEEICIDAKNSDGLDHCWFNSGADHRLES